jgi:flagellar protein FlaF
MGYAQSARLLRTTRGIEYDAFARITRQLSDALTAPASSIGKLAEAIHQNRLLWSALASDLVHPDNALPAALKGQLLSLSEFVRLHSSKVLNKQDSGEVLIDINTAIMKGLRAEPGA